MYLYGGIPNFLHSYTTYNWSVPTYLHLAKVISNSIMRGPTKKEGHRKPALVWPKVYDLIEKMLSVKPVLWSEMVLE
jgi:hypothetical protein